MGLILLRPKVTPNVRNRSAIFAFERAVASSIVDLDWSAIERVQEIILFPRICDPGIVGAFPALYSYKKSGALYLGDDVEFFRWQESAQDECIRMLIGNATFSLSRVRPIHMSASLRMALIGRIESIG